MHTSTIEVECPTCEDTFTLEVEVSFPIAPSGMSGPPENYDPGDPGEVYTTGVDPIACPRCKHLWDKEEATVVFKRINKACDEFDFGDLWESINEPPDREDD